MSKEKALQIIKNLERTIKKMKDKALRYDNSIFQRPSVAKAKLKNIKDTLIKKYKL